MTSQSLHLFLASEYVEHCEHDKEARISDLYSLYQAFNEFRHPTDHLDYEPFVQGLKDHGLRVVARRNRVYGIKNALKP